MTSTVPFSVVADPAAMTQLPSGSIIGPLHVVVGDEALPAAPWHDFPVVVLAGWCQALSRRRRTVDLDFMDGPCALHLEVMPTGLTTIWFVDSGDERELGAGALADVRNAVLAAATAVLDECGRRGWSTPLTRQLARACARLRRVVEEKRSKP
jgi:hypothetical protein